jgi:pimeloyl-ACP methyl ester carboxylesterase
MTMLFLTRTRLLAGLALAAGLLAAAGSSRAQAPGRKPVTKNIDFKTFDGVTLHGTFYPNPSGKKDAVAILLHEPNLSKGGSTQQEGWSDLAAALQADGYAVLMFDFRGFGESKSVNPEVFYKQSQNMNLIRGAARKPSQINYKDFTSRYIPYLVNDIAAAKAYLDRQNDQKACNTSSVIVVGAGESAALGALWMANETRRAKDKANVLLGGPPMLGDPESKDLAAGVWLSASPTVGGASAPWSRFIAEVTREQKIPMLFVHGEGDKKGAAFAKQHSVKAAKDKEAGYPRAVGVPGASSAGHRLLGRGEPSEKLILDALRSVMEKRGSKEWSERKVEASQFWYTQGKVKQPLKVNKRPGEEVPPVDVALTLGR